MEALLYPLVIVTVTVAAVVIRYASPGARRRRAMKRARQTRIADVKEGERVKVVGTLRYLDGPVEAPITGRICAAWHVRVTAGDGEQGEVKASEGRCVEFLLDDGTGVARVVPDHSELLVVRDRHLAQGLLDPPTERMERFLARHGQSAKWTVLWRSLAYREGVLEEGEIVAAVGVGTWEPDHDPRRAVTSGYRGQTLRLRITGSPDLPALLSDDPELVR